jgi:putative hydrolase of the HAD superfamily
MNSLAPIKCLFVDIGGVLLTNGWDHLARERAATKFELDFSEIQERHHLTFDTFEEGKLSLEQYLERVIFYRKRPFTKAQFKRFMFAQSRPFPEMISLISDLKVRYGLDIVDVSNEGQELNSHRIRKFKLCAFVDAFISSCFVQIRKPDEDIYRLALNIAQKSIHQIVYIEDVPMFVQVAEGLGIRSILHTSYETTRAKLASLGLHDGKQIDHRRTYGPATADATNQP